MPSLPLACWLTDRVEFSIKGQSWPLIFNNRALMSCQEITGIDMLSANLAVLNATFMRAIIFSALLEANCNCTLEEVGDALSEGHAATFVVMTHRAWILSMPDPDESKAKAATSKKPRKPLTWMRAWAIAREELNLSNADWMEMTNRQIGELQEVRLERLQREEFLVGIIAATTKNYSFCKPDHPASPESFMLHPYPVEEVEITGEYIMNQMARIKKGR